MDTKRGVKPKTLVVEVTALVQIDYAQEELDAMGKSFREFKAGVERTIGNDLLPSFQADPHTKVSLGTISYPSPRKFRKEKK